MDSLARLRPQDTFQSCPSGVFFFETATRTLLFIRKKRPMSSFPRLRPPAALQKCLLSVIQSNRSANTMCFKAKASYYQLDSCCIFFWGGDVICMYILIFSSILLLMILIIFSHLFPPFLQTWKEKPINNISFLIITMKSHSQVKICSQIIEH